MIGPHTPGPRASHTTSVFVVPAVTGHQREQDERAADLELAEFDAAERARDRFDEKGPASSLGWAA